MRADLPAGDCVHGDHFGGVIAGRRAIAVCVFFEEVISKSGKTLDHGCGRKEEQKTYVEGLLRGALSMAWGWRRALAMLLITLSPIALFSGDLHMDSARPLSTFRSPPHWLSFLLLLVLVSCYFVMS